MNTHIGGLRFSLAELGYSAGNSKQTTKTNAILRPSSIDSPRRSTNIYISSLLNCYCSNYNYGTQIELIDIDIHRRLHIWFYASSPRRILYQVRMSSKCKRITTAVSLSLKLCHFTWWLSSCIEPEETMEIRRKVVIRISYDSRAHNNCEL